ncbi:MAG: DUF4411 family protein [Euryarchaeota archaeon]
MADYCIDTSALIDGWKDYPPENFGVWNNIRDLINENRLISPYHVLDELGVGGDDLYDWCRENHFFCSPTTETPRIVTEIKNNFPDFKPKKTPKVDWADPWVIAIAIENEYTVISHETRKQLGEKASFIPDICDYYGLGHATFLELIKEEDWRFF